METNHKLFTITIKFNRQHNELLCANLQGDLAIFKERNSTCWARASNLGMVTACVIGDITNVGKNHVIAINTEGWLYIFDTDIVKPDSRSVSVSQNSNTILTDTSEQHSIATSGNDQQINKTNGHKISTNSDQSSGSSKDKLDIGDRKETSCKLAQNNGSPRELIPTYEQRMPANSRVMLLADLDGDKLIELIIGLTDRVLRTYRWIKIGENKGKFVGVYKWEFADQIGAVSLNPSSHDGCQDIIVAQPGGTYAKLECIEKKSNDGHGAHHSDSHNNNGTTFQNNQNATDNVLAKGDNMIYNDDDNVPSEYVSKLTPEYHQLALTQMRNPHISTEILGGIRGSAIAGSSMKKSKAGLENSRKISPNVQFNHDSINKLTNVEASDSNSNWSSSLIVISTLDGTLMLVNKDEVLWSIQVDHQLFALDKLEILATSTPSSANTVDLSKLQITDGDVSPTANDQIEQYLIACAWDGKTYIVDEDRNYLRFKFSEAVSSFAAGNYYFDDRHHASLIYATFNNQIILYHDVELSNIKPRYLLDEIMNNPEYSELLTDIAKLTKPKEAESANSAKEQTTDQISRNSSIDSDLIRQKLYEILYEFER